MVIYFVALFLVLPQTNYRDYLYLVGQSPRVIFSDIDDWLRPICRANVLVPHLLGDRRRIDGHLYQHVVGSRRGIWLASPG